MAKRGRPRHPDILTLREWEVLSLLREGLSNEQIAERLDITERTTRFHVSEILSKLGVSTRQEAATWQPEERQSWWALAFAPLSFGRAHRWLAAGIVGATITVAIAGIALLVWGLMRTQGEGPPVRTHMLEPAPTPLDVVPRPAKEYAVAYVRPISGPMGTVYVRVVDAATGTVAEDIEVGPKISGNLALTNTPNMQLVTFGPMYGQAEVTDVHNQGPVTTSPANVFPSPRSYQGAVNVDSILYQPEADTIIGRDRADQIVVTYDIPRPLSPRGNEPIFTTPRKGIRSTLKVSVSVMVPTATDDLIVFVEGLTNSVAAHLGTGRRLDLIGYDRVFDATLAKDGYIYALVHNAWYPDAGFEVAKIDPVALQVVTHEKMDFNWRAHLTNGFFALAAPDGNVFIYLPSLNLACPGLHSNFDNLNDCPAESLLYQVDRTTASVALVPLPLAIGIDASVGIDGKLYFYDGVGENRVSRYDPATSQVEVDVPALRAPEGTYVQAVAVR